MQIKLQLGKLQFEMSLPEMIRQQQENGVEILPVEPAHVYALDSLPVHHKDPFDRLLIAQAIVEEAAIITADPLMAQYPVKVEW
jgi:PIN domain nuclease of toxin-antitoxin system